MNFKHMLFYSLYLQKSMNHVILQENLKDPQ
jgi:hypothetical protein